MSEQKQKVLITGGAGLIGSILIDRLSDRYDITSFDLKDAQGANSITGDLYDFDSVRDAFEGQDFVVHLAADRSAEATWESALKNNFVSTYNVFEAAKQTSVKRVVFASSQHATGGFYLPLSRIEELAKLGRPSSLLVEHPLTRDFIDV